MQACIPGCESFARLSASEYQATVVAKLVFVKVHFRIDLHIEAARPDQFYQFHAQGDGGLSGGAEGRCEITLIPVDDRAGEQTQLSYRATVYLQGVLQKVAEPLLKSQANALVKKFFKRFERAIESIYPH